MKIAFAADSTCDLSMEQSKKLGVRIVPLTILVDGREYSDGVNITQQEVIDAVSSGKKVTTAAVNGAEYERVFSELLRDADAVISLHLGSGYSSCFNNARLVAEDMKGVYPVDTRSLCNGSALLVMDAMDLAAKGLAPEDIVRELEERRRRVDAAFLTTDISYLQRGGRCSSAAAFGAKLLSIRPSVDLVDGEMRMGKKYRGSLERCLRQHVQDRLAEPERIDPRRGFVCRSPGDEEMYRIFLEEIGKAGVFEELIETHAGCSICTHCGPNTYALMYERKA